MSLLNVSVTMLRSGTCILLLLINTGLNLSQNGSERWHVFAVAPDVMTRSWVFPWQPQIRYQHSGKAPVWRCFSCVMAVRARVCMCVCVRERERERSEQLLRVCVKTPLQSGSPCKFTCSLITVFAKYTFSAPSASVYVVKINFRRFGWIWYLYIFFFKREK